MHHCRRLWPLNIGLSLLLALCLRQAYCWAQNPPQPLPMNLVGASALSDEQLAQITTYVKHFGERLNNATEPAEVEEARASLIKPLIQPDAARLVSPVFRLEYSKATTPEMQKALSGTDLHRAVNALLVLSQLGESRAADAVLAQTEPGKPWQIRNQAASALRVMLQGGALDPKKSPQVARRIKDAVAREDHGLVLAHLLAALDAATETVAEEEDKRAVRGYLVEAMASVADRVGQQAEFRAAVVDAFVKELERLRPKYAQLTKPEQVALGKRLAPALGKILAYIAANWDAAREQPARIERIVGACETSLQFINIPLAGPAAPETNLKNEWIRGDKTKFDQGVAAWQKILAAAPYN
jgi:hypothetical protein